VIITSDPAVQDAATLITTELGQGSDLSKWVTENISSTRLAVQVAYNLERAKPESMFTVRYSMLVLARQLYDAALVSPSFFAAVSGGAAKVGQTHADLKKAVTQNKFTSAEIARDIGDLQTYVMSVKDFYETIQVKH